MNLTYGFRIHPGCCHICHTADQSLPVIDTCADDLGVIRRYLVMICAPCCLAMAKMVSPGSILVNEIELNQERANKEGEINALNSEVLRLRAEAEEMDRRLLRAVATEALQ